MLYTHPTIIVFISVILLLLFRNYSKIFGLLITYCPFISVFALYNNNDRYDSFSLFSINFISKITHEKGYLAFAFICITLIASIYAANNNRKWEVVIGTFANFAALLCLFAEDFISMFIGIELLMIASTILIFMGGTLTSIKAAKQYFLTHLFSSGLILIGISYLIVTKGSTEIIPLTDLINNEDQGFIFYTLLMTGCLINVAVVPFGGWFVNCYPEASSSGFIYLTAFSTKIGIIILMKLFSGLAALKFIGIAMMIYGGFYACFEENLRKIICYLIISQLGLMVVAISTGKQLDYLNTYIPIHIYYITIFIYLITLLETINIKNCNQIENIKNFTFSISLLVAFLMISNFPFTIGFLTKLLILQNNLDSFTYYLTLLLNITIFIALPFREYFIGYNRLNVSMLSHDKSALFSLILMIFIINFIILKAILSSPNHSIENIIDNMIDPILKQLVIITIGIVSAFIIKLPRNSTKNFNLDLYQYIEKLTYFSINKYKEIGKNEEEEEKYFNFKVIRNNILNKISIWHNGQTSIFVVMLLLISLILMLQYNT